MHLVSVGRLTSVKRSKNKKSGILFLNMITRINFCFQFLENKRELNSTTIQFEFTLLHCIFSVLKTIMFFQKSKIYFRELKIRIIFICNDWNFLFLNNLLFFISNWKGIIFYSCLLLMYLQPLNENFIRLLYQTH